MIEGTCLCGTVRFQLGAAAGDMSHCHCSMCRKAHGSAFATYLFLPPSSLTWLRGSETIREYESSPGSLRHFCGNCGSTVPTVSDPFAFVPASLITSPFATRPQAHIFAASRAPWMEILDELPQHDLFPPGLGFENSIDREARPPATAGAIGGSCLCGRVSFEADPPPLRMVNCHCSRCRLARAAAHATNLFIASTQFRWLTGEGDVSTYQLPDARAFGTAFCSTCGSLVPRYNAEAPMVNIPAGCLDTDPGIAPQLHIYTAYRAPWFEITGDLPQFEESPPRRG